jgi:hypothetical protein
MLQPRRLQDTGWTADAATTPRRCVQTPGSSCTAGAPRRPIEVPVLKLLLDQFFGVGKHWDDYRKNWCGSWGEVDCVRIQPTVR